MSQGTKLLDEALELAGREKAALEEGGYDEAMALAGRRGEITARACGLIAPAEREACKARLGSLLQIQKQLSLLARTARDNARLSMNRSKQEQRRMRGYHAALGLALQ